MTFTFSRIKCRYPHQIKKIKYRRRINLWILYKLHAHLYIKNNFTILLEQNQPLNVTLQEKSRITTEVCHQYYQSHKRPVQRPYQKKATNGAYPHGSLIRQKYKFFATENLRSLNYIIYFSYHMLRSLTTIKKLAFIFATTIK